jgi:hypothetical protein
MGSRSGRMKPCAHCGMEFYCFPSRDIGGSLPEKRFCSSKCAWASYKSTPADFWSKVKSRGHDDCWLWTGAKFKFTGRQRGYGRFSGSGPYTYAHRAAWIFTNGSIPEGKLVMHTCDVPLCCNPAHLILGTDAENHADSVAKGRHTYGERTKANKLSEEQVREIIALKGTTSGTSLAKRYGVGPGAINAIWRGDYWKHIPRSGDKLRDGESRP